jgi:predicted nucleic-acid-binding protein
MIGLDSNVLVRFLTQDDPVQSPKANELIEQRLTRDDPGFVSLVAMAETAWVLERSYDFSGAEIAAAIERMLRAHALVIESKHEVFTAMVALQEEQGSFPAALVGALGAKAGCSRTLTFDQKALRLPGFESL